LAKGSSFVPDDDCSQSGDQWEACKTHIAGSLIKTSNSQQERNYDETKNFNKSLALAAGSRPKLQATSGKLQASSRKLDKKTI